ncbi:putative Zn-dependent peptidase [Clostridium acetobutylicum]|uniref:Zn-dependent peptidase from MPP family n=1 Tax=Clostridium acetobutylicum (strain ATCC 824 / DSM 792 / JCM 1419 / IAM 19013 / LMG 5710 / NBRC 13948 / NRRL B-527 / VKM B-1787 / 2291 / W) TaxID=272562 RepID=Q97IL0_CLOAB|nr:MULTISPECIES: pitrilysin family protein [Clostridium]AAK79597.1 Zn-dependent peptidase from MPP family [Clostridium acetobutylicum ATCC 824]ADZ20681.1 Zn-dependent peptidase from MPP family [Clostridium acetobutylicum EA 2018]AEI31907.1 zinc-dependent peptidase [Clostridium acetobutylicum DSM 1731]AWV79964.1 insulinase family protein [Clostridium acetobutylicum]MBC2394049.1 insulinase family protein [Clostridium acetobutylicum]
MKKICMKNGMKIIYEYRESDITSFCVAFNAGAEREGKKERGLAHVVEHCIFKGTKKRSEAQINSEFDEIFGFNNAMTNFPYVIYYGTTLSKDFEKGFELYSDIIVNPTFSEEGFEEEKSIICEELTEWKDDKQQFCEDELLKNSFSNIRLKECIIGNEKNIKDFSIDELRKFYKKYYTSDNCVIGIVTSLKEEEVTDIINNYMTLSKREKPSLFDYEYEKNTSGIFTSKMDVKGAVIQYLFPIYKLKDDEIKALRAFNVIFGEGTSSMLYDKIRTKYGLAYDIYSKINNDGGIKLFYIGLGTASENFDKSIEFVNDTICEAKNLKGQFSSDKLLKIEKTMSLKRSLKLERSIQLAKELATYELMYGKAENVYDEVKDINLLNEDYIIEVVRSVLVTPSIQVVKPNK